MKILLIHTFYNLKGGEDFVFEQESNLLSKHLIIDKLMFHNKQSFFGAFQFLLYFWNLSSSKRIKKSILEFKPDIIHVHNFHFASGPIIIRVANKLGIPIVVTLHNYRLLCPSATLLSNDSLFLDSITSRFPWLAIKKKLYRNSYIQTFWLGLVNWLHKKIGTWYLVDKYIVLTGFSKNIFLNSWLGRNPDKFVVKPNFIQNYFVSPVSRNNKFLFVGRLSEEKGITLLLNVFKNIDYQLLIAGDGPLLDDVCTASNTYNNITYLGSLNKSQILNEMNCCTALLFPSIWYEGMPMTILEAFSVGTPVIASNLGAMASMITHKFNGLHFETGNSDSLKSALDFWVNSDERFKKLLQENAKLTYDLKYTPEKNLDFIIDIYKSVLVENT
ncbi:glycosyltransferase family 4 protein [Runella aurantiaca]|uniref:Glycosyltransferase n=1 Tax=Runella aurantiaca TaxID=2282308 RepID=A0A369IB30_9BACT|nr:glycosyltransferase family 4 protein [Runella aurantiaca]RDB04733.1 glycosyltransferase [Runella aurantiaca]